MRARSSPISAALAERSHFRHHHGRIGTHVANAADLFLQLQPSSRVVVFYGDAVCPDAARSASQQAVLLR